MRVAAVGVFVLLCRVASRANAVPVPRSTTTTSTGGPRAGAHADDSAEYVCYDTDGAAFDVSAAPDDMACVVVTEERASPLVYHCTHAMSYCEFWCVVAPDPYGVEITLVDLDADQFMSG